MKAHVINEFVDKYTGVLHEKGSTFSCDMDRFKEIQSAGNFIEEVKENRKDNENVRNNRKKV